MCHPHLSQSQPRDLNSLHFRNRTIPLHLRLQHQLPSPSFGPLLHFQLFQPRIHPFRCFSNLQYLLHNLSPSNLRHLPLSLRYPPTVDLPPSPSAPSGNTKVSPLSPHSTITHTPSKVPMKGQLPSPPSIPKPSAFPSSMTPSSPPSIQKPLASPPFGIATTTKPTTQTPRDSRNSPTNAHPPFPSNPLPPSPDIRPKPPIQATTPPRSQARINAVLFYIRDARIDSILARIKSTILQARNVSINVRLPPSTPPPTPPTSSSPSPTTSTHHPSTTTCETTPSSIVSLLLSLCYALHTCCFSYHTLDINTSTLACTIRSTGSASL